MRRCVWTIFAAAILSAAPSRAAVIFVGDNILASNTPDQTVQIFVTGHDAVQGLNFYAQIADGGPEAGGVVDGPNITAVDVLSNTIFAPNNEGQQNPGSLPQLAARTTTTLSGTVDAEGLLATLTIDTTGFTTGSWPLKLTGTLNGSTDFAGLPISITDGSISLPEPGFVSTVIGIGLMLRRRRKISQALSTW
jgi:hypothetical protein